MQVQLAQIDSVISVIFTVTDVPSVVDRYS